jgi:hypothetical protein
LWTERVETHGHQYAGGASPTTTSRRRSHDLSR